MATEETPLQRRRNLGMIAMDLKAIWEMSVYNPIGPGQPKVPRQRGTGEQPRQVNDRRKSHDNRHFRQGIGNRAPRHQHEARKQSRQGGITCNSRCKTRPR
jgi:hypothetical protein